VRSKGFLLTSFLSNDKCVTTAENLTISQYITISCLIFVYLISVDFVDFYILPFISVSEPN